MYNFLSACKKIEEIASNIYQHLSNDKAYSKETRKVFSQLSDDEKAHMRHIDLALQANKSEMKATQTISGDKINEAVADAERIFRQLERERLDEEKALILAVNMEKKFVDVHVQNALNFDNQGLTDLFDKLGKEDECHIRTLLECLNWWQNERKQTVQGT